MSKYWYPLALAFAAFNLAFEITDHLPRNPRPHPAWHIAVTALLVIWFYWRAATPTPSEGGKDA